MADFGFAPYAWLKDSSDNTPYVGVSIADSVSGFPDYISVSDSLEHDLAEWATYYDAHGLDPEFDLDTHNSQGLQLSRRLKQELGDTYRVVYCEEHPELEKQRRIEITLEDDRVA